ncbi:UNVERIFIED_CONTAM: hypothetical protein FKN15_029255 [Acipenser sinensis]
MISFFSKVLDVAAFQREPEVDRVHRSLAPKPKTGERPRPMIVQMHRFQDKEQILHQANEGGPTKYHSKIIVIFPDLSADLASFNGIKSHLRSDGIKYGLLYPARLTITTNGATYFFATPEEASLYLKSHILPSQASTDTLAAP